MPNAVPIIDADGRTFPREFPLVLVVATAGAD
jgi:hypothetical protein